MTVENFLKEIQRMRLVFSQLTPLQKTVIKYRWGFIIYPEIYTLEKTGEICKVSRERIRQIDEGIKKKMNAAIELMKEG